MELFLAALEPAFPHSQPLKFVPLLPFVYAQVDLGYFDQFIDSWALLGSGLQHLLDHFLQILRVALWNTVDLAFEDLLR